MIAEKTDPNPPIAASNFSNTKIGEVRPMAVVAADKSVFLSEIARDWVEIQEPKHKGLWIAMLRAGRVGWRTRMLGVNCGTGGQCALGRGLGAEVKGVDRDPDLVAIARQRVHFGEFQTADATSLPFEDGEFDCVMADRISEDRSRTVAEVAEMARVCARRGRVAVAAFTPGAILDPTPMAEYSRVIESVLVESGLQMTGRYEVEMLFDYPDAAAAVRAIGSTPGGAPTVDPAGLCPFVEVGGGVRIRRRVTVLLATRL